MDPMLLRVFQGQVLLQCEFMLRGADDVQRGLQQGDISATFYGLQSVLNASANISKVLWGQKGKFAAERKEVRDSIGVRDDSPLREVDMRNNYEHFDERLDKWWAESKAHNFADRNIGPRSVFTGLADIECFRMYDPVTTDLIFWGQDFNVQKLVDEVIRILPKVREEAGKPHWWGGGG